MMARPTPTLSHGPWATAGDQAKTRVNRLGSCREVVRLTIREALGWVSIGNRDHRRQGTTVEFRYVGNSGIKISEITYGNWLTHGSQVENDQATACVRAALDAGITTFDTADVYANTKAESVLGAALKGERRESLEILTKVYWPTGPKGHNDVGLSRKHIMESINGSLARLQTDYVDIYQAHRYDYETPLEETMQAFADLVRMGKVLYIGVSEWTAEQIQDGYDLADELGIHLISSQPQYSMLWRVIEADVIPLSISLGVSQIVFSPIAQGVLTGKYRPGEQPPAGSRATDEKGGADMIKRWMSDEVLKRVQQLEPLAKEAGLSMAQLAVAWVLQNGNVASAIIGASRPEQVHDNAAAAGVKLEEDLLSKIDEVLDPVVQRDPAKTWENSPKTR
jgi:aryl-alcohol dehydrogenase-like predicted oxidoreductase